MIRGGTSSVGLASIQIARLIGVKVIATTRNEANKELLMRYGASDVLIDDNTLLAQAKNITEGGVDKILELVGTATLKSSFNLLKSGGILCMTGILGGEWELKHFAPMDFIPSGSYFTIYDSQDVCEKSLKAMLQFLSANKIKAPIAKIFTLNEIVQAHELMETNRANGKIIVVNS